MAASTSASKANNPKARKRVDVDPSTLKRARDGSAFTRCDACKKDVPVATADMHNCQQDGKIWTNFEAPKAPQEPKRAEAKKPAEEKRSKSKTSSEKKKKPKKEKKVKDPNLPKRPQTAFFLFMDDFRKSYKEANPEAKGVAQVAKEGGEKWKSLSEEEKKQYTEKAAELKAEYEKAMAKYQKDRDAVVPGEADDKETDAGASGSEAEEE
ncbi:hypothetical protein SUGI_0707690 [Cryptomeria japonica]|uniref:high mobility group B protein 3 n=1 Tax=Cryptomeria japonica TaxID=3369 RepID=UPI0024147E38|nr:high mobility group B protein 3 [Cryptomeria japonica]GLJ35161.1 hypothetical protein SUGI_0707690 [Cryptomeria japonica]